MDHKLARSNAETAGYPRAMGERIALVVILGLYTILQLINIGHGGHMGQDWITHRDWLKDAATQPWDWLQGNFFQTDPPLPPGDGAMVMVTQAETRLRSDGFGEFANQFGFADRVLENLGDPG